MTLLRYKFSIYFSFLHYSSDQKAGRLSFCYLPSYWLCDLYYFSNVFQSTWQRFLSPWCSSYFCSIPLSLGPCLTATFHTSGAALFVLSTDVLKHGLRPDTIYLYLAFHLLCLPPFCVTSLSHGTCAKTPLNGCSSQLVSSVFLLIRLSRGRYRLVCVVIKKSFI